jgi:hypothetical protein
MPNYHRSFDRYDEIDEPLDRLHFRLRSGVDKLKLFTKPDDDNIVLLYQKELDLLFPGCSVEDVSKILDIKVQVMPEREEK